MSEGKLHVIINGRVQGVGFRWFIVDAATRLDLAGWVKNREDGGVEVYAAGDAAGITQLETLVSRGPRGARVERVVRLDHSPNALLERPFRVSR